MPWKIYFLIALVLALIPLQVIAGNVNEVHDRVVQPVFPGQGREEDWRAGLTLYVSSQKNLRAQLFNQSIADATNAIRIYPYDPDFYNQLAINYWQRKQKGDLEKGIDLMRKAIELNPKSCQYWDNLAKGLADANQLTESRDALVQASVCNPTPEKLAEIRGNIATLDKLIAKANPAPPVQP